MSLPDKFRRWRVDRQEANFLNEVNNFVDEFQATLGKRDASRYEQKTNAGTVTTRGVDFAPYITPRKAITLEPTPVGEETVGCPSVSSLECDSISVSKSKCGFATWDTSGPRYLKKTTHQVCHSAAGSFEDTCIITVNPITCVTTNDGGSAQCGGATTDCDVISSSGNCPSPTITSTTLVRTTTRDPCPPPFAANGFTRTETLSDEYTTAALKTNTIAALPPYSGFGGPHSVSGQGTSCSASAVLSGDESSYSIRRFKPRFNFSAPICAGAVLTYTERFEAIGGGGSDVVRTWTASGGETSYDGPEVLEPSSNGSIFIVELSLNCEDCPEGGVTDTLFT